MQWAKVIAALLDESKQQATQAGLQFGFSGRQSGVTWVKRFYEKGLVGLKDKPKAELPRPIEPKVRNGLSNLVMQKLDTLGYPYKMWTLERMQQAFKRRQGVHLSDSTIWE